MPPSTNTRSRQTHQSDEGGKLGQQANNAFRIDLVADNVRMYPVFCTSNIPPKVKFHISQGIELDWSMLTHKVDSRRVYRRGFQRLLHNGKYSIFNQTIENYLERPVMCLSRTSLNFTLRILYEGMLTRIT